MAAPFLPVKGVLGSVYLEVNPRFQVLADPFSGEDLVVVQALCPDVTLIHGSQGDDFGNILIPRVSDWDLAVKGSRKVIATVEERVAGPLTEEPEWRLIPALHLTALALKPQGAWPTEFPGHYGPDEEHLALYLKSAKDPAAWDAYLQNFVFQEVWPPGP
jgi:glutaconate CoA-transferase subunit A